MKKRIKIGLGILVIVVLYVTGFAEQHADAEKESTPTEQVVVYYFHGDVRCTTCRNIEAYAHEAVEAYYGNELKDSQIVWSVINYDTKEHEHFLTDYKLYNQALILSRQIDGKETDWVNLEKIWEKVGDKESFIAYVKAETDSFISGPEDAE